jgi:hypothetical protein
MWEYRIFVEGQDLRPQSLNIGLERAQTRERSMIYAVLDDPQLALAVENAMLEVRVREWIENDVQLWRRPFRQKLPLSQALSEEVAGLIKADQEVAWPIETTEDLENLLEEWKLPCRLIAVSEQRRLVHRDRLCIEHAHVEIAGEAFVTVCIRGATRRRVAAMVGSLALPEEAFVLSWPEAIQEFAQETSGG